MADKYNFLNFTVFDFETSGLDPRTDHIIEACVIRVRDGAPVSVYNTLVQMPEGKKLVPKITEITGHTDADLASGIDQESLAYLLWGMIPEGEMLVAYNALFDISFLANLWRRYQYLDDVNHFDNEFIDPLTIARNRDPYPHKLKDSCKRHDIPLDDAHSAYADTFALVDLVIEQHKKQDISEWVNVVGYRPKYGEPTWYPECTKLVKQGAEVIEHSKKPVSKPKVKPRTVATTNKKKPSPASLPPKEFDKLMPTAFISKQDMDKIDLFCDDPFADNLQLFASVEGEPSEYDRLMEYLTKVKHIEEDAIEATLDNPAEAHIIVVKRSIDIRDEDLPF
jgi:DNA polymerase III subunit epsilon